MKKTQNTKKAAYIPPKAVKIRRQVVAAGHKV